MSLCAHRSSARALHFFLFAAVFAAPLFARDPWDAPPFSADPAALLAAAEKVPAADAAMVVLLDEAKFSFESDGRTHQVWRHMVRVVDESAIDDVGTITVPWAPWYYERPSVAARVVSKDGTVHALDQKAITEAPGYDDLDIFSDNRLLRAPLPAVGVGSVIEYTITYDGKSPIADAGTSEVFIFGTSYAPTERTRLTIDGPTSLQPQIVNNSEVQAKSEEKDGRRVVTFESGRIEGRKHEEGYLPFDAAGAPYVAFSTGASWQSLARQYGEIVDKQIAAGDIAKFTRDAIGTATDRAEVVARALAAIQKNVRYAGVEVGESSIVPRAPKTVLANKYGDCKDKATLLVAMLRQAGLEAHVALLRSGFDFDVISELPGMGRFNHAIVYVGGDTPLWVDPTDEFARAGELPSADQGRLALVAGDRTTALLRAPETPSTANRYAETRIYTLPEDGKAKVVEITETSHGSEDAYQRRYYAGSDRKAYREQMESYVKSYYVAKALAKVEASDPHDLSKPFRVTVEATDAGTGVVRNGDAAIALHPFHLLHWVPHALRESDEERAKNPDSQKRKSDFIFSSPAVHEWTYRVIPPAGYAPRTLPQNETLKLGMTTLMREYAAQPDGSVTAVLRFDSGKRRISAAEFEQTRLAISKLLEEKSTMIGFDSIGHTKMNAGDIAGALAEFRSLAQLHPTESQHHTEMARALLVGGLGDAARAEARKAVALEPKNARAYLGLAGILEYDLLGRLFRKGFDMPGALAALRKAKELDPKNAEVRDALSKLLTYGSDGMEFSRDAKLDEAIAEYRAARKELEEKDAKGFDNELMTALPYAGKFADMKELAGTMEEGERRDTGKIIAIAATDGAAAALKELAAFEPEMRRKYATTIGQTLFKLRLYGPAADILESAMQGANASSARPFIEALRKAKRLEDLTFEPNDPLVIVRDVNVAVVRNDLPALQSVMAPELAEEDDNPSEAFNVLRAVRSTADFPPAALSDVGWTMMRMQVDGNEKTGYRVRVRTDMSALDAPTMFVTRVKGRLVLEAVSNAPETIGKTVLRLADAGDLETARLWLNWLREDVSAGGGDDPLQGPAFAALWPKENSAADLDQIRTAAASLMARKGGDKALAILAAAREKATSDSAKAWIDVATARIATQRKEWKSVVAAGERLYAAYPDSETALSAYAIGLADSGRVAEAVALAKKHLEKHPKDVTALRMLSLASSSSHDYAAAAKYAEQIIEQLTPSEMDYNNAAWYEMFAGNLERALENARRATNDQKRSNPASLHTLATLYAETGKNLEAHDALLRTLDGARRDEPGSSEWYIIGRMAENYGVLDAAVGAYKRVENKDDHGATVFELAQKRLAALNVKN